jgi:sugar phosphate isomerase/epimerase
MEETTNKTEKSDDYDDYREDVREWIKANNSELTELEEAVQGLLIAFKRARSTDFYDSIRKLVATNDLGIGFLQCLLEFMKKYEKEDDKNYREELVAYITKNTEELKDIQERVNYLVKAYKNADDFLDGAKKLEEEYERSGYDLVMIFLKAITVFVESGLEDYEEEEEEKEEEEEEII